MGQSCWFNGLLESSHAVAAVQIFIRMELALRVSSLVHHAGVRDVAL